MGLASKARAANDFKHLLVEQCAAAKSNFNVYLDDFISVVQGGPRDSRQILRHLFHQIYWVFCPNEEANTNRKDPISLKNQGQGYGGLSTRKTVLWWDLDTIAHLLRLPPR